MDDFTTYDAQLEKIVLSLKAINIILAAQIENNAKSAPKDSKEDEKSDDEKVIDEPKDEPIEEEPIEKKGGE